MEPSNPTPQSTRLLDHPAITPAIGTLIAIATQCKSPEDLAEMMKRLKPIQDILKENLLSFQSKENTYYRKSYAEQFKDTFLKLAREGTKEDVRVYCEGVTQGTLYMKIYHALNYYVDFLDFDGEVKRIKDDIMICRPPSRDCIVLKLRSVTVHHKISTAPIQHANGEAYRWKTDLLNWMEKGNDTEFRRSGIDLNDNLRAWINSAFTGDCGFEVVEFTYNSIWIKRV